MFSRRDLLKYAAAAASFLGPLVACKAQASPKTKPFGYLPKGGVRLKPGQQVQLGKDYAEPTDGELHICAINMVAFYTGTFLNMPVTVDRLRQEVVFEQFQLLRKQSPLELIGFLNRYARILLRCAGVVEHDGFARALKMHEDDLRYQPKEQYPWLRHGGVPYNSENKPGGPTGRIAYETYDLSGNPTVTPRYVKDIDAFTNQETLADYLWAAVSTMRDYVRSRPGIVISEADCYVRMEPFQLEYFVWLREAVKVSAYVPLKERTEDEHPRNAYKLDLEIRLPPCPPIEGV